MSENQNITLSEIFLGINYKVPKFDIVRTNYQTSLFIDNKKEDNIFLESRRYIGNKTKLIDWIMQTIDYETKAINSFIGRVLQRKMVFNANASKLAAGVYFIITELYSKKIITRLVISR